MKTLLALLVLLAAVPAHALERGKLGVGPILGVPFGVTGKYWLDGRRAIQAATGITEGDFSFSSDLLVHFADWLPRRKELGPVPVYLGAGLKYKAERKTFLGIRFVGGVSVRNKDKSVEVFAEIAPVLRFAPSEGMAMDGAVGARWYF